MDFSDMFTVTPMNQKITLEAGQTYTGSITVANPVAATNDFIYKVEVTPYSVADGNYDVDFLTETERSQIVNWIMIENPTGTLKPNESTKVKFTITVPETAPPGGQYAMLAVSSAGSELGGGEITVTNIFEMGSILYAKVAGALIHDGQIIDDQVPGFVTTMPIVTSATLSNDGNIHEEARIALEVKSFFSSQMIYPQPGESGAIDEMIMPGTTRYVTREISDVVPLGIYEVTQTVSYMGNTSVIKKTVVACPLWFMALVAATITAIVLMIVRRVMRRRAARRIL